MSKGFVLRAHAVALELNTLICETDLAQSGAFIQHGSTSVLLHCIAVAFYSLMLLDLLHVKYDRRALVRGALLHDFFGYDWHKRRRRRGEPLHAFQHPKDAAQNAKRHVKLTAKEENIILRHMFPLTLKPPADREGAAVCLIDKCCTVYETFNRQSYPVLRRIYARALEGSEPQEAEHPPRTAA